jgi:hypothetical protein
MIEENHGTRVVVRVGQDEQLLWPHQLRRCAQSPWDTRSPYNARRHNEWCRKQMVRVKAGSVVEFRGTSVGEQPRPWVQAVVIRTTRANPYRQIQHTVRRRECINEATVVLTRRALKRARRHNKVWSAGLRRPPRTTTTERQVVSPRTFDHLKKWIFNAGFVETLKASEQNVKRGHSYGLKESPEATYPRWWPLCPPPPPHTHIHRHTRRYVVDAEKVDASPVSRRVYRRVLRDKLFVRVCICVAAASLFRPEPES